MTAELPPAQSRMEELMNKMIELQEENNKLLKQIKRKLPKADEAESEEGDDADGDE